MESVASTQQYWLVQPLIDAGLELEEIRVLLFRLSFDGIVHTAAGTAVDAMMLVDDQPAEVRAAWAEMIDRMITLDGRGE